MAGTGADVWTPRGHEEPSPQGQMGMRPQTPMDLPGDGRAKTPVQRQGHFDPAAVQMIVSVTACDESTAKFYLQDAQHDPNAAINNYFQNGCSPAPSDWMAQFGQSSSSSSPAKPAPAREAARYGEQSGQDGRARTPVDRDRGAAQATDGRSAPLRQRPEAEDPREHVGPQDQRQHAGAPVPSRQADVRSLVVAESSLPSRLGGGMRPTTPLDRNDTAGAAGYGQQTQTGASALPRPLFTAEEVGASSPSGVVLEPMGGGMRPVTPLDRNGSAGAPADLSSMHRMEPERTASTPTWRRFEEVAGGDLDKRLGMGIQNGQGQATALLVDGTGGTGQHLPVAKLDRLVTKTWMCLCIECYVEEAVKSPRPKKPFGPKLEIEEASASRCMPWVAAGRVIARPFTAAAAYCEDWADRTGEEIFN